MNDRQIKFGAILSYFLIFFNIIVGLLYTPWMVNKIGRSDYGLYILVTTFLTYFVVDFGMWQAINKIICQYRAEGRNNEVKNVIGQSLKIYLCLDIIIITILTIVYFNIDNLFLKLTPSEIYKFKIIFIIAGTASVLSFPFNFIKGVLSAHEFFIQLKCFDFATKILTVSLTIICLYMGLGLYALVIAFGFTSFFIKILQVIYLKSKGININLKYHNRALMRSILGLSVWLFVEVLAELFVNNISPSILATFSGTEEIAIFAIGLSLYGYVYSFAGALNGLFLPKISRYIANNEHSKIENITFKIERFQFLVIGYIILAIILTGPIFIESWMGPHFNKSYYVAILLLLPGIVVFGQAIESTHLFASGKIRYRSICMIITALVSVILSIILSKSFGAIGVAIGICSGTIIGMVCGMNIIYYKVLNFNLRRYTGIFIKFMFAYVIISILFIILKYSITLNTNINGWRLFFLQAIIYTVIFTIVMWIGFMNLEEKNIIKNGVFSIKSLILKFKNKI